MRAGATVYATALAREPELDGVRDDHWALTDDTALDRSAAATSVWAGTYGRFAYLFVAVADRNLVYQQPTRPDAVRRSRSCSRPSPAPRAGGC